MSSKPVILSERSESKNLKARSLDYTRDDSSYITPPPGSDLYYCLRKIKPPQKNAVVLIEALFQAIFTIPFKVKEDAVALAKLQWWQQEIERAYQGKANHPLTQNLTRLNIPQKQLISLVENTTQLLQYARFEKFEDLTVFIMQTYGLKELMIASCFDDKALKYQEDIFQIALGFALVDQLQNIRLHLQKSFIFFAENEMAKYEVTANDLLNLKTTPAILRLFQAQADKAANAFDKKLPKQQRLTQSRIKLASKWLKAVKEENFAVLEKNIAINPLYKLFLV